MPKKPVLDEQPIKIGPAAVYCRYTRKELLDLVDEGKLAWLKHGETFNFADIEEINKKRLKEAKARNEKYKVAEQEWAALSPQEKFEREAQQEVQRRKRERAYQRREREESAKKAAIAQRASEIEQQEAHN